jgi:predicted DNA-binding transcriptional regulator AlpA
VESSVRSLSEYPPIMTIPEIAAFLRISRAGAYELTRRADFPLLRFGSRSLRVIRDRFAAWLASQAAVTETNRGPTR